MASRTRPPVETTAGSIDGDHWTQDEVDPTAFADARLSRKRWSVLSITHIFGPRDFGSEFDIGQSGETTPYDDDAWGRGGRPNLDSPISGKSA
jgi:hypothetical protein